MKKLFFLLIMSFQSYSSFADSIPATSSDVYSGVGGCTFKKSANSNLFNGGNLDFGACVNAITSWSDANPGWMYDGELNGFTFDGVTNEIIRSQNYYVGYSYYAQFDPVFTTELTCLDPDYPDLWSMNGTYYCSQPFKISESDNTAIVTALAETLEVNTQAQNAVTTATIDNATAQSSADAALKSAVQAVSAENTTASNLTTIDNLKLNNPDINILTTTANTAQESATTATASASSAIAAATDASVTAINANQAYLDIKDIGTATEIAYAQAQTAQADAAVAATQADADAAVSAAQTAVNSANSAITNLVSSLDSISNSLIQSVASAGSAAGSAADGITALGNSNAALNTSIAAVANGEVCVGDKCLAVDDPIDEPDSPPANYGDHGSSDYESFGAANTAFYTGLKSSALVSSFANVGNAVNFSGGSCTPLTIDLSMTIIGTSIGTNFNCSLFETNGMRDIISACMLILYGYCGFRIFVSA